MPDSADSSSSAVERLDAQLERLRHATFGLYRPALRIALQDRIDWPLTPVHYRLLRVVEASGELRPTVGELAASLLTDKARASRLVAGLADAGLVRRRTGRLDRRRREIELTAEGRALLAEARSVRVAYLERALSRWGVGDAERLAELLEQLNAAFLDDSVSAKQGDNGPVVV